MPCRRREGFLEKAQNRKYIIRIIILSILVYACSRQYSSTHGPYTECVVEITEKYN